MKTKTMKNNKNMKNNNVYISTYIYICFCFSQLVLATNWVSGLKYIYIYIDKYLYVHISIYIYVSIFRNVHVKSHTQKTQKNM